MRLNRFGGAVCFAAATALLHAQLPAGSIDGIARDATGAHIQNASITASNEAQGTQREARSNADGSFTMPALAPGAYTVIISSPGFGQVRYPHVLIEAGKATTLDTTLLAATATSVDVGATNAQVDLTQSIIQGQITSSTIGSIPLNGRNFLELAFLIPGNRPAPNFDPTKTNTVEVSSASSFGRGGNITIDGGDNNDEVVGGTLANLPEDSVGEFQIATARFTAEVGRSGNSIINVVTRSGTNQLHGSAFIYERNRHLQGLPATFDRSQPVPRFDREQVGGSLGGPLQKDKAFLFSSVEFRDQNAALQTGTRVFLPGPPYGVEPVQPALQLQSINRHRGGDCRPGHAVVHRCRTTERA